MVAWRQTADFVTRYFRKGSMIAVQGSIQTRNYEDKTGAKRTAVEIVADSVSFCGSKADSNEGFGAQPSNFAQNNQNADFGTNSAGFDDITDDEDDEFPF